MSAQAYLRCMGQPVLTSASGQTIRFRTKKHLALLTYLVVEEQRQHRRERLAELLWPKVGVSEGRHSLATALSILRARLGPESIMATREHVTFAPEGLATDLDRLIRGEVVNEAEQPLEVAGFLEGFDIPDAMEFGLWKDRQQARLLPFITKALRELVDHCRRIGDTRRIELLADRMLALDELSEEAIRAKMEARALAGDRLTALRIYEAWEQKLAAELKAVPSAVVEGMAIRLRRRGWERTALANIPTVRTDQWKGRSFCGRAREYRTLYETWEQTKAGGTVHPLVLGDSGIGKTTLVDRFTTSAGLGGAAVARVQCYGLDQDVPYATLCSLVKGLIDQPGVSATPPESLAALASIVPEIRGRWPNLPAFSTDNAGETARLRYAECFHDVLVAVADEQPLILVVDDLHLSDESSLAVLHLAMRNSIGRPLMVVMTARPDELRTCPQACRLRDAKAGFELREMECSPLQSKESLEVLSVLASDSAIALPLNVRRSIVAAAAGFPMVLELLYQDWQAHGEESLALGLRDHTVELRGADHPPQLYREVLDRLLRSMDTTTQAVLNIASILGPRLNDIEYYSIADLTIGQTMIGLTNLAVRRVLRDSGRGLEFANELLRTAAYLGVPSPLRRALHGNIADKLIKDREPSGKASALEIAWHCMRAGREEEATRFLLAGAREAIRAGATESAERALTSALNSLRGDDEVAAWLLLAEVHQEQGRPEDVLRVLSSLNGRLTGALIERAVVLEALAARYVMTSSASLRDIVSRLDDILKHSEDASTRALAVRAMAYLLLELRDRGSMSELLRYLERTPQVDADIDCTAHLALAHALLLYHLGDRTRSLEEASSAVAQMRSRGTTSLVTLQLQCGLGSILSAHGQYEGALSAFQEGLEMAKRLGNDRHAISLAGNIALCYGRLGRYEDQLEWATKALATMRPACSLYREFLAAYSRSFALAMLGRSQEALGALEEIQARSDSRTTNWQSKAWALWKADVLQLIGHTKEAIQVSRAAVTDMSFDLETPAFAGPFARWLHFTDPTGSCESVEAKLADMSGNLHRYDTIDQADILCTLRLRVGKRFSGEMWVRLENTLNHLPSAVARQLASLGVLTDSGPTVAVTVV